jgi:glycosyltransferase involved in cell wall biosynthesis
VSEPGTPILSVVHTVASLDQSQGGLSRAVSQLSDALCEQRCDASVVFVSNSSSTENLVLPMRADSATARAIMLAGRRLWSPKFMQQIAKGFAPRVPRLPRLIHDNGLWGYTNYAAARFAARQQIPLVVSPHGMLEPWAMREKRTRKLLGLAVFQRNILNSAALLMATAESEYENVRRFGLRQPVAVVPLGVALPQTRAHHAVATTSRSILFLSRIHPVKGLLPFIRAWHRVGQPGWRIIIAGPDEAGHLTQVRELISQLGMDSQFEFPGAVEGPAKRLLFESADLFVLPTLSENFGVVVAEAMSYGLPVLTTRAAPWSILETIKAGWWVEPRVEGLADGLRAALSTTPEQRAALGEAGRAHVAKNLGWATAGKMTSDAYAWLLGLERDKPAHVHLD